MSVCTSTATATEFSTFVTTALSTSFTLSTSQITSSTVITPLTCTPNTVTAVTARLAARQTTNATVETCTPTTTFVVLPTTIQVPVSVITNAITSSFPTTTLFAPCTTEQTTITTAVTTTVTSQATITSGGSTFVSDSVFQSVVATTTVVTSLVGDTTGTSNASHKSSVNLGAIIGGVAGGVGGIAAFLFVLWFCIRRKRKHQFDDIEWPETANHHAKHDEPPFSDEPTSSDYSYRPSGGALSDASGSGYRDYPSPQPAVWPGPAQNAPFTPPMTGYPPQDPRMFAATGAQNLAPSPGGLSGSSYPSAGPQTVSSHYAGPDAALLATGALVPGAVVGAGGQRALQRAPSAAASSSASAYSGTAQSQPSQPARPQLQVVNGLEAVSEAGGSGSHAAAGPAPGSAERLQAERLERKAQLRAEDRARQGEAEAPPPAYSA